MFKLNNKFLYKFANSNLSQFKTYQGSVADEYTANDKLNINNSDATSTNKQNVINESRYNSIKDNQGIQNWLNNAIAKINNRNIDKEVSRKLKPIYNTKSKL